MVVLSRGPDYPYYFINNLHLREYDSVRQDLVNALYEEMSYRPSNYERTTAYQRGQWDGYVRLLRRAKNGTYFFPSGFLTQVEEILQAFGVEYQIEDQSVHRSDGLQFKWVTDKILRDYQKETVDSAIFEMLSHSGGALICLPTGSGKSLIMCRIIFELGQKSLIVVHTKDLLHQWREVIHDIFGFYPAIIGDSVKDDPGKITISTVQTMSRIIKENPSKIHKNTFNVLMFDECFPAETLVKTEIGDIPIGEIVEKNMNIRVLTHTGGWRKITGHYMKKFYEPLITVEHEFGKFTCTGNHKILTELGWVRAEDLNRWDSMIILHEQKNRFKLRMPGVWERVRQRLWPWGACTLCTQTISGKAGQLATESTGNSEKYAERETKCNPQGSCSEISFVDGFCNHIRNSKGSRVWKLVRRYVNRFCPQDELQPEDSHIPLFTRSRVRHVEIRDFERYSGNSSKNLCKRGLWRLCSEICNTISPLLERGIRHCYQRWETICLGTMDFAVEKSAVSCSMVHGRRAYWEEQKSVLREGIRTHDCVFSRVENPRRGRKIAGVVGRTVGSENEYNEIFKGVDSINIEEECCESIHRYHSRFCSSLYELQDIPGLDVYDIEVEGDHSYIANGVVVHNCHKIPSDSAYAVSVHFAAKYRLGASATPTREDNTQLRIVAATGNPIATPSVEEFIDRKILAVPEFRFYRIPFAKVYGNKWHNVRMDGIVRNDARNDAIVGAVRSLVREGHRIYVSVDVLSHGKRLLGLIETTAPDAKAVFLQGKDNSKRRKEVFADFKAGKINVMVSTLLREGVDIPEISAYINAAGGKSEVSQIQRVGRALRQNPEGDKKAVIIDFVDGGHRWLSNHWDQRWRTYRKYYGDYCPFPT